GVEVLAAVDLFQAGSLVEGDDALGRILDCLDVLDEGILVQLEGLTGAFDSVKAFLNTHCITSGLGPGEILVQGEGEYSRGEGRLGSNGETKEFAVGRRLDEAELLKGAVEGLFDDCVAGPVSEGQIRPEKAINVARERGIADLKGVLFGEGFHEIDQFAF